MSISTGDILDINFNPRERVLVISRIVKEIDFCGCRTERRKAKARGFSYDAALKEATENHQELLSEHVGILNRWGFDYYDSWSLKRLKLKSINAFWEFATNLT